MKPIWIFMIVIACPVTTLGQGNGSGSPNQGSPPSQPASPPYQPAVSPASTPVYGAGWGYGAGQTPAGAALQGLSQVISSAGQYNLDSSAAAVNLSQAEYNEMRNASEAVLGFWAMRDFGRMEREKERGPRATPEELARRAHDGAPRVLNPKQIDPVSGELTWPLVLKDASFEAQRIALGKYTAKWMQYGGLDNADRAQVCENIDTMLETLKSQITSIPPQDYVEGRAFLESLLYATTRRLL